ncbi:MAG: hypothetical protein ACM33T_00665 [Solirubrobacterales bacterium]
MALAEDIARSMPSIRAAFEGFKEMMRDGRMKAAEAALFGNARLWGEELKEIYAAEGREDLGRRDPLTRFFVCRYRGMPEPADLADAPPEAAFLIAFTAFPYLDALVDEMGVGEHVGFDEDGNWIVRRVLAGEDDGSLFKAAKAPMGWRFDLMPVYHAKAAALAAFIDNEFAGDFDAFLWRYVADHDLAFDLDQAWRPLAVATGA